MHRTLLAAALLLPMIAACGDSPFQPAPEPSPYARQHYQGQDKFPVVKRIHVTSGSTVSATVGENGGVLSAGGVVLVIPPRALASDVPITMTVADGSGMTVELLPHGLQFSRPATLGFLLTEAGSEAPGQGDLLGVYHADGLNATEVTPLEIMNVRVFNKVALFGVWHFSDYSLVLKKGLILVGG